MPQRTSTNNSTPSPAVVWNERGFALPFTIFLVALITVMLTSAFTRTATEHQISDGSAAAHRSLAVAQSGLNAFFGDSITVRPVAGDSIRYNVAGGYAWVVPQGFQLPADTLNDFIYIVRSTGYFIEPNFGPEPRAKRSLAKMTRWRQSIYRPAAYIAANENDVDYGDPPDILINGADACIPGDTIGGAQAPLGSEPLPGTLIGNPGESIGGNAIQLLDQLGLDWEAIENGDIAADYTSLGSADGDTTYATYVISGYDTDINAIQGTGLLIVLNRIDSWGFEWDGVIIAGKDFDVHADSTIVRGMLITGLDAYLGDPDYPDTRLQGDTYFEVSYDSCKVARAFRKLRRFVAYEDTWIDNWATY